MKKICRWVGYGSLAIIAAMLFITPVVAAEQKIGFIDVQKVLLESVAGKKADGEFQKLLQKDKALLDEKQKELEKMKAELDKQGGLLNEKAKREKEENLKKRYRDYQLLVKDTDEALVAKREELLKAIYPDIIKIIKEIGAKEKFTILIDPIILQLPYYSKDYDITKQVTEEFNNVYSKKK